VLPSVVELDVVGTSTSQGGDEFPWRFFFGDPNQAPDEKTEPKEFEERGLGSGILVRKTGKTVYVLTNNHVVTGAKEITVKLHDEREFAGTVVGTDTRRDLAVVSFQSNDADIRTARLGDSDAIEVGDWAIAIGSPYGLFSSVTAGIVSAIGRDGGPEGNISDFIQTDAANNPGNSGGPLLDSAGRLIGVNTAIYSPSGASAGVGFAVPVDTVNRVVPQIIAKGRYSRPALGVEVDQRVNEHAAEQLGLKGVLVLRVRAGSGAQAAGLQGARLASDGSFVPGDIITRVGGKAVDSVPALLSRLDDFRPGDKVMLTILRAGQEEEISVMLQAEGAPAQ